MQTIHQDQIYQGQNVKKAILMKLSYERYETYINMARAIAHIHWSDEDSSYDSMSHVLDLMKQELNMLADMLETDINNILNDDTTMT